MNDCYFEKKDWRLCKAEVCFAGLASLPRVDTINDLTELDYC